MDASTFKGNLIVGARAFHDNPYDGHTLNSQLEQSTILMQDCAGKPETVFVDLGYRSVETDNPDVRMVHRGKPTRLTAQEKKQLKRRQAIEPIIGHLKADHRMNRCHLKGETGDHVHAVLCAGYNIKWLLRMIAKKDLPFLWALFLRLQKKGGPQACRGRYLLKGRQLTNPIAVWALGTHHSWRRETAQRKTISGGNE